MIVPTFLKCLSTIFVACRVTGRSRTWNFGSLATRSQRIALLAVLFGSAGLAPVDAGNITSDLVAGTSSFYPGNQVSIFTFGTTSTGGVDMSAGVGTAGLDTAKSAWFQDHFGFFARTSVNSIGAALGGQAAAHGILEESILIPAQQGTAQGDPGTFHLFYHLDGTVNIDLGSNFDSDGNDLSAGRVHYQWTFFSGEGIGVTANIGTVDGNWLGNHISAVVNRDVEVKIPIHFGVPFYYATEFLLEESALSRVPPSEGFVEGDFLHTGTLLGGAVFDQFGDRLSNPEFISDSGFNYVNPQSESPVPEPASFVHFALGLAALAGWKWRRRQLSAARL